MATIATAIVAVVVLTIVLTRPDGGSGGDGEVFLQAAGSSGPDPYTESTARKADSTATSPTALPSPTDTRPNATRGVDGSAPGLYGGTRKISSCDVEKQITALTADPPKNKAFASVLKIQPSGVPEYLRSLTPVQLRMDTRVTNHGYQNGAPIRYQAVLQAGTAVLVDDHGVPRVRCACGNPLLPPVAVQGTPRPKGDSWPTYRPSNVVAVTPTAQVMKAFVIFDPESKEWFRRDAGDTGHKDKKTSPPVTEPSPSPDASLPSPDELSPSSCPPEAGEGERPADSPCPPASKSPSPKTPTTSKPPTSEPPASETVPEPPAPDSPVQPEPPPGSPAPANGGASGSPASP